jgi:hypothetical protein
MAKMQLKVDATDISEAMAAIGGLQKRLKWPSNETFRMDLLALLEAGRALEIPKGAKGAPLVAMASSDLLDLMRKYDPAEDWWRRI